MSDQSLGVESRALAASMTLSELAFFNCGSLPGGLAGLGLAAFLAAGGMHSLFWRGLGRAAEESLLCPPVLPLYTMGIRPAEHRGLISRLYR